MTGTTLALVEIDNHNEVFAALGQASLEIFLDEFAERVSRFARDGDELIKVQPNKYCVLLNGLTESVQIELAGAKLARLFEAPITIVDEEFKASVHTAFVPPVAKQNGNNRRRLQIAESALIEARTHNRPYVIRDQSSDLACVDVRRPREIELAFERGEFVMYYQPLVHAGYRSITGAEALMRWHHPEGVRAPGEFIPYLERSAILNSLTWFTLKSSMAQAADWPNAPSISVNLSPLLILDPDLIPNVSDALSLFDFPADRLVIEITEDAMIENPERTKNVLQELRSLGIQIALDDFGIGYSSLASFRELPVDKLKIDRSFVSNLLTHPRDKNIVKAIIDLAHAVEMKVVAEGVEDEPTASLLQEMGADLLQGYYFGKPMQAADLEKLLT